VVYEDYLLAKDDNGDVKIDPVSKEPVIRQEWIDLIEKYPNNFLLGSDKVGDFTAEKYKKEIRKFDPLLNQLTPDVAKKVATGNWLRIVPKEGLTLPRGYKYPEFRYIQRGGPRRIPVKAIRSSDTVHPWLPAPKEADSIPVIGN
jgi:hypothetical protein